MVCTYSRYIHYCPREDSRCLSLKELGGEAEGGCCSWRWVECSREQKSLDGLQEQHWAWWGEGSLGERWRRRAGRSPVLKQWRPKDGVGLVVATMGIGDLSAWAVLGLSSAWEHCSVSEGVLGFGPLCFQAQQHWGDRQASKVYHGRNFSPGSDCLVGGH